MPRLPNKRLPAGLSKQAQKSQNGQRSGADKNRNSRDVVVVSDGWTVERKENQANEDGRTGKVLESRKIANSKEVHAGEQQRRNQTRRQQGQEEAEQTDGVTEERRMNQVQLVVENSCFGNVRPSSRNVHWSPASR